MEGDLKRTLFIGFETKSKIKLNKTLLIFLIIVILYWLPILVYAINLLEKEANPQQVSGSPIFGDGDFTFTRNGSFISVDAGREWPINSKREISFRFKTKNPHGLLIYQTFENKLSKDQEEADNIDLRTLQHSGAKSLPLDVDQSILVPRTKNSNSNYDQDSFYLIRDRRFTKAIEDPNLISSPTNDDLERARVLSNTASAKLANSIFSLSHAAPLNGNDPPQRGPQTNQISFRDEIGRRFHSEPGLGIVSESNLPARVNRIAYQNDQNIRVATPGSISSNYMPGQNQIPALYEMYLKLENGRLKITYEFASRINQTHCGKGLNDDKWHSIDLKVDPETNKMALILDQLISVEIVLSQTPSEEEMAKKSDTSYTSSILYIGGLDNRITPVRDIKDRLHMAQFIGCIGQIVTRTDQSTESHLQPVRVDKIVQVQRGCIDRCDFENYCLHKAKCINFYTHAHCDCFGTNHEDDYCWNDNLTTLTMLGHSMLIYRVYDWRDRHHLGDTRVSLEFKTLAPDSILFFAQGEINPPQNMRHSTIQSPGTTIQSQSSLMMTSPINITTFNTNFRPPIQAQTVINYLSISLANGSIVVEVNFGEQPIVLSNIFYDKLNRESLKNTYNFKYLSDGQWHRVTVNYHARQLGLTVDNYTITHNTTSKFDKFYFEPGMYFGAVPNLLLNETKALLKPFHLRHKFVGCIRSVYLNQNNVLLSLKKSSVSVEYRDPISRPLLDVCISADPSAIPITLRSGKSYLTFQLTQSPLVAVNSFNFIPKIDTSSSKTDLNQIIGDNRQTNLTNSSKKQIKIEFEYRTALKAYFLAGGHLRDSSYHDLGGYWTLHSLENCKLQFIINPGLPSEPDQVMEFKTDDDDCDPQAWFKVDISMSSGGQFMNMTRSKIPNAKSLIDEYSEFDIGKSSRFSSYRLNSSLELLHQVQLGGDLAKFGGSNSIPFSGCMRKIKLNGRLHDSREFVTQSMAATQPVNSNYTSIQATSFNQPDLISNRIAQGYITLDSCQLIDSCAHRNPCKNNGTCKISDLGDLECDCSKTGYTGRRCHFSLYKQSCNDLYLSGQRKSSHYLIDLDRNGPLRPIRVRCNMDEDFDRIETALSHNLPSEFLVGQTDTGDLIFDITYLSFHHMLTNDGFYTQDDDDQSVIEEQDLMLRAFISQSLNCKQSFRYDCRSAPLDLGNKTWMIAPYPKNHRVVSLDGKNNGKCMCATSEKKCLDPDKNCNCDSSEPIWADDSHELSGHENVGITKIVTLRQNSKSKSNPDKVPLALESQSRFTLGDLKCYGSALIQNQHEITFKTNDAYIEVPGWRKGDISFSFRTASSPPAIILYQLATSRNHGYFRLFLMSDTRLQFEYIVNRKPRKITISSAHKLNNGEWQQVYIEYDSFNLRFTVNDDSMMLDLDQNDHLGTFEGPLFIGGAPTRYLQGDLLRRNGFTGCFRGLTIGGRAIDLRTYLSPLMPTVTSGCMPSCRKNLCQNGGKCIEYWGSYECECSNPLAHSGVNCEINLNTNSITFITPESHYVQSYDDSTTYSPYLVKSILLNIRTYQETALILYACDQYNNFVQLHKNGSTMVLTFNSNTTIVTLQVPIDDKIIPSPTQIDPSIDISAHTRSLSQNISISSQQIYKNLSTTDWYQRIRVSNMSGTGQPVQIKIERLRMRTTLYVNNNLGSVDKPIILLNNYSSIWSNPELESVRKLRPKVFSPSQSQIFLANINEHFLTRLPGFTGCIQGFIIDNQLFDFNRAHLIGEFKGEYKIGCKMHCDSFPCKNQGTCIENWKEDRKESRIICKCEGTSFVGHLCDEDVAAIFNGHTSYFIYNLTSGYLAAESQPKQRGDTIDTNSLDRRFDSNNPLSENVASPLTNPHESITLFDVSLAFSSDSSQSRQKSLQVLVWIKWAKSSRYFFIGLQDDGSLVVQEDFGGSTGELCDHLELYYSKSSFGLTKTFFNISILDSD